MRRYAEVACRISTPQDPAEMLERLRIRGKFPVKQMTVVLLLIALGLTGVVAAMPPAPSHCGPEEQVIFSCGTNNGRTVSLCASSTLTPSQGYLQYRIGPANNLELVYSVSKEHPKAHFLSGSQMYSGRGSAYLKFRNGDYTYVVFTGIGKGWEKERVVVERSGKRVGDFVAGRRVAMRRRCSSSPTHWRSTIN